MTIITFLGLIGGYIKEDQAVINENYKGASYTLEPQLRESLDKHIENIFYPNMLGMLIDQFFDKKIIAIGTKESIAVQKKVMEKFGYTEHFPIDQNCIVLEQNDDFNEIFRQLDTIMEQEDEVIVDISHGFRHIPILMTIQMIVENIQNPKKIKHILFAKEEQKDKSYTIIDLQGYMDLSAIAYAFASFEQNYTIANHIKVRNPNYKELLHMLQQLSEHILSNSFKVLFKEENGKRPLIVRIEKLLDILIEHPVSKLLERNLRSLKNHMLKLQKISSYDQDMLYYHFAYILFQKGYLLNAATILNEAVALYCLEGIRQLDNEFKEKIEEFERKIDEKKEHDPVYNNYNLATQAKSIIKFLTKNKKPFLNDEELSKKICTKLENKNLYKLKDLIYNCDILRNDIAHGNTQVYRENIKIEIQKLFDKYRSICIENDPLKRFI